MWFYDVFISHASEDKESFVRPLAERLRTEYLEVWYDEFSLRLGDSLRQSIDRGLARSRYGVVVLSPAFLAKKWPQRELNGLTAREMVGDDRVILPIWHGVTKEDVLNYSPPLADVYGADSSAGLDDVVSKILSVVRPRGSPLIVARDELLNLGLRPPVVTDEWWLDVVEACNREPAAGFVSQRPHWGRWSFPLPPDDVDPEGRGLRIARTALQLGWEDAADSEQISQITPPDRVLDFIRGQTFLSETCHRFPLYLATYAPQLTIRGFGGEFEVDLERLLQESMTEYSPRRERKEKGGSALSVDGLPPGCDETIALRHPHLGYYRQASLACQFVQGDLGGPPVKVFETIDYAFWILSDKSLWLPSHIREALSEGLKQWATWPWGAHISETERSLGLQEYPHRGVLSDTLYGTQQFFTFALTPEVRGDLEGRAASSQMLLALPEEATALATRFIEAGFVEEYFRSSDRRRRRIAAADNSGVE